MTRTLALRLSPLALLAIPFGCARPTPPPEEAPPAPVVAGPPKEETLGEWSELLGATQPLPNHAARVTAAVEGRVLWLLRDPAAGSEKETLAEGQEVRQGQVIGKLDDRVARANRDKVAAGHEEVKEQLRQAGLAVQTARLDVNRLEKLQSGGKGDTPLVARVEVDKARIALKDAESKREALTARLAAGKAELKALDEQLDLYTLRAPIAGRLGTLHAVPGQTLAVGALVAEIVDLREIDVVCSVPPHTAAKLALGQPARLVKNDGSGPRGQVTYIAVQAQPETGNFVVKARFPNPDLKLRSNTVLRRGADRAGETAADDSRRRPAGGRGAARRGGGAGKGGQGGGTRGPQGEDREGIEAAGEGGRARPAARTGGNPRPGGPGEEAGGFPPGRVVHQEGGARPAHGRRGEAGRGRGEEGGLTSPERQRRAWQQQQGNHMTRELNGRIALVTGASRGLGAAIAKRLAAGGAKVA